MKESWIFSRSLVSIVRFVKIQKKKKKVAETLTLGTA